MLTSPGAWRTQEQFTALARNYDVVLEQDMSRSTTFTKYRDSVSPINSFELGGLTDVQGTERGHLSLAPNVI